MRVEMMLNNAADFGMNKGLANWDALVALSQQCNQRLLTHLTLSQDCFVPLDTVRALGHHPTRLANGQRAAALRFGDERVMALLMALAGQAFIPGELTNKTLRSPVAQFLNQPYTSSQMSYDLRRLRLKGLLLRVPHSHRYRRTALGSKVACFFTKLYTRVFRPGLTACEANHPLPNPLAAALDIVATEIDLLFDLALFDQAAI